MKILYYNWVDYLDPENRGGGITIYQRNLMKALKDKHEVESWFLSSGISFDVFNTTPRWDRCHHGTSDEPRRYEKPPVNQKIDGTMKLDCLEY
jgi:hypothetical protein